MKPTTRWLAPVAVTAAMAGCAEEPGAERDVDAAPPVEVTWESCDLVPGSDDGLAACAAVDLPLDYADPSLGTTVVTLKRQQAQQQPRRGQVWLLHGGPGGSGSRDLASLALISTLIPDMDFITLDHRGTGAGDILQCPQEIPGTGWVNADDWPACLDHLVDLRGEEMPYFTTTNSAHDLGTLIDAIREEDDQIFVKGGSYGTYLAHRYLQLYPEQPDGVIMTAVVPADTRFNGFNDQQSATGLEVLDRCAEVEACQARLGSDPAAFVRAVQEKLDTGHCAGMGLNSTITRIYFGEMLMSATLRDFLPALAYRLDRCNTNDEIALKNFFTVAYGFQYATAAGPPPPELQEEADLPWFVWPLFFHVSASEMWDVPDEGSISALEADWMEMLTATGREIDIARQAAIWPTYPLTGIEDAVADYDGPLLMMHGGRDPTVSADDVLAFGDNFTATHQNLVIFPDGAHGLLGGTPATGGGDCAATLEMNFLNDPTSALHPCVDDLVPLLFAPPNATTEALLGTLDLWGDQSGSNAQSAE